MKNKIYFTVLLLSAGLMSHRSSAQTNPVPFDLASGNYSFTSWDSAATAGTYPANMIFHFINSSSLAGFDSSAAGNADWDCAYNRNSRNRILGLGNNGFAFIATSSPQFDDCTGTDTAASLQRFVGDAVLGLNTTNRINIVVSWTGGTITPGDGNGTPTNPRVYVLRLQYRTSTSGSFTDVPGPVQYMASQTPGDVQSIGPVTLPAACENIPDLELRWIYFQVAAGNGGTRPKMSVDEITVSSSVSTSIRENITQNSSLSIYPNPSSSSVTISTDEPGEKKIILYNALAGRTVEFPVSGNKITFSTQNFPDGLYFVELIDKNGAVISKSELLLN